MEGDSEGVEVGGGGATRTEKRDVETSVAMGRVLSNTSGATLWRKFSAVRAGILVLKRVEGSCFVHGEGVTGWICRRRIEMKKEMLGRFT